VALVADVDSELGGFVSLEIHRWDRLAQIHGLAVHPDLLGQRLGASLVEAAERIAREAGCRGI
jgi:N-acetylglutamate synthase-like GNAT family acetyltransferase